jgi:hypothetical protein
MNSGVITATTELSHLVAREVPVHYAYGESAEDEKAQDDNDITHQAFIPRQKI